MNVQGVALALLLQNKELKYFERLHSKYFNSSFSILYTAISQFYLKYEKLPSQSELELENCRNIKSLNAILALKQVDIPDIDPEIAITVLENNFAQQFTLHQVKSLVQDLPFLDTQEILDTVAQIPINIEAEIAKSDKITTGKEHNPFRKVEDQEYRKVNIGLNNELDLIGGALIGEMVILGGRRGAGKSVVCCNLAVDQYSQGKIAPYFTIEMNADEISDRIMSIMARVTSSGIREQTLEGSELLKLALTKSLMYVDGFNIFDKYSSCTEMSDLADLVDDLNANTELNHPLYIIDDRELKLSTVDITGSTLKTKYGDLMSMLIVDYVNQLNIDGSRDDKLDWKSQITASTKLKSLGRKLGVVMVSPYQIDANGEARLSKGLLDSVDLALTLGKTDNSISYTVAKTRSLPIDEGTEFESYMDWNSLSIIPSMLVRKEEVLDEES